MKEKYILLKKKAIILSLVSSIMLCGCSSDKENEFNEHYHYIFDYGNMSFLIRECDIDLMVQLTTGGLTINKNDLKSSNYTAIKIKTEEDEEHYRSIEEKQLNNDSLLIYKK